jgi:hypothetical protein
VPALAGKLRWNRVLCFDNPVKPRQGLLLLLLAVLLAVPAGWLVLVQPAAADESLVTAPVEASHAPGRAPSAGSAPVTVAEASAARDPDAERNPDAGTVRGVVSLTPGIARELKEYTVMLTEAVNQIPAMGHSAQRLHRTFRYDPGEGSPSFVWSGIPFSAYGYKVSVVVPDCNAAEQHVALTREKPTASVTLGLWPASVYHVFLRDQDRNPLAGLETHLLPVGEPPGRKSQRGTSDSYGKVEFERVIHGSYSIVVGNPAAPLHSEELAFTAQSEPQAHLTVPRGMQLVCQVNVPGGYGLADVSAEAVAIDTKLFKRYQMRSDTAGKVVFQHLLPGMYQVRFEKNGYTPQSERVTIKDKEPVELVKVEMAPVDR